MTLATWVTLARLVLCVPAIGMAAMPAWDFWTGVVFLVCALTDWLDGYLARKYGEVTDLGKLLDPLVDKILVVGMMIAAVGRGLIPAWFVVLVASREFMVTGLRALEAQRGIVVQASGWGKAKTVAQITYVCVVFLHPTVLGPFVAQGWREALVQLCLWVALALTALSGGLYMHAAREAYLPPRAQA